jgi:hypothetical protein
MDLLFPVLRELRFLLQDVYELRKGAEHQYLLLQKVARDLYCRFRKIARRYDDAVGARASHHAHDMLRNLGYADWLLVPVPAQKSKPPSK